jgi:hypothetical protein
MANPITSHAIVCSDLVSRCDNLGVMRQMSGNLLMRQKQPDSQTAPYAANAPF